MASKVVNIKVCSPLKLHSGLTGNYHAICHYSYNLPLGISLKKEKESKFYRNKKEKKIEMPTHKAKVFQPFPQSSLRWQIHAFLPTRTIVLID